MTRKLVKPYNEQRIQRLYENGIGDAAKPQPWEVTDQLVKIKKENPDLVWKNINGESYLLVSSWKADTTYYKNDEKTGFYSTGKYQIWVTAAPELQAICQKKGFGRKEGLDLRLKQLLGLPPDVDKQYFVEFWARPQDLFRPCLDKEIAVANCNLAFPENSSEAYKNWINNLRIESYYHETWDKNYPWTQLGYTYDWNPGSKTNIGVSEFVIDPYKDVIVHAFYTTESYCKSTKN
jgi:hypothetical protein